MSALLLSTACMRGLWPLLMSWLERKKSTMGKVRECRAEMQKSRDAVKPTVLSRYNRDWPWHWCQLQHPVTFLPNPYGPAEQPDGEGSNLRIIKKGKACILYSCSDLLHIEKTDISYRGTNKCLQSCLEIWQCDTTLTPDHKGRKCPLPTHTPKTTNPTHTWGWLYIFHTHQQTVKAVKEIIRIGVFTVVM